MQMTKELIGYNKKIKVIDTDDIYTYKTLRDFKKKFTRCKFTWIMGMDSLKNFHLWDKWQEIAKKTTGLIDTDCVFYCKNSRF